MSNGGQYLAILRKRLWLILLTFAVTMTVILFGALTSKPVYQAAVRLQVIPTEFQSVDLYNLVRPSTETDVVNLTAFQFSQVVRSSRIAWQTIAQLGLNTDADSLLQRLRAVQDNDFMTVIVEANAPQEAEAIVTAQVENALASYRADRARPAVTAGEFINAQLAAAEKALSAAQAEYLRFKLAHNIESLEREILAHQDAVRELKRAKDGATVEAARLTARIRALEAEAAEAEAAARAAVPDSNAETSATRRANDLRSSVAVLRGDLAGQRAMEAEYDRAIAQWETELTSLIGLNAEHTRLTDALAQAQNTRDFLANKAVEAQLKQEQGLTIGYLKVVEPARRPDQPLPNRTLQIALLGGLLSLLAGIILAFVIELAESGLRSNNQAPSTRA